MAITNPINTDNSAFFNTDMSKIFLGGNETITATYTNSTGSDETLTAGQLFGRISASGIVIPLKSGASDGSQYPVGFFLGEDVTVADGASITVTLVNSGEIAEDGISLDGTDTLATAISGKQIKDRITSDTQGMKIRSVVQNTKADNS